MGSTQPQPNHWVTSSTPHGSGTTNAAQQSSDWAGYIDMGSQITGVSAQWIVPTVQTSHTSEVSSTWIGIDGTTNTSLIQTGTSQDTANGTATYLAWYEILPAASVPIGYVSPGDTMKASIIEHTAGTWEISIADITSGQEVAGDVAYDGPGASAEWIEEDQYTISGQQLPVADFQTAQFNQIGASSSSPSAGTLTPVEMVDASGNVLAYPSALNGDSFNITYGSPPNPPPSSTSATHGDWLVGSDGGVFTFGFAQFYGSTGAIRLQRPIVGITPTANDRGYWLVASDGGVFSFGNAGFYGSIPGLGIGPAGSSDAKRLNAPIVGMVPSADGRGYCMVAADGGVFTFGDARFAGSCPGLGGCGAPAVAVMPDQTGNGYWLVTSTGSVFAFGDARIHGSPGPQAAPVVATVATTDGGGYLILLSNGTVDAYGDAATVGGSASDTAGSNPASAIFTTSDGKGYWVATANGSLFTFGDAPNDGSLAGQHLNGAIIAGTAW